MTARLMPASPFARTGRAVPVVIATIALVLTGLCHPAEADSYTYTTIIVPNSVSGFSGFTEDQDGNGINSSGTLVGSFTSTNLQISTRDYTDQAGVFSVLPVPPNSQAPAVIANGINDSGLVVGTYFVDNKFGTTDYGYTYRGGVFTTISDPSAYLLSQTGLGGGTFANAVNNAGAVAGYYTVTSAYSPYPLITNTYAGFVDVGGVYSTVAVPGASSTYVFGINNNGALSGYYADTSGIYHGFLDQGGVISTIDVPGATNTYVTGLNDQGQLVGYYTSSATTLLQGFLDDNGVFTTLSGPPRPPTLSQSGGFEPSGINDAGVIVGAYYNGGGSVTYPDSEIVLATPTVGGTSVPEPASLPLLTTIALLGVGLSRRRA